MLTIYQNTGGGKIEKSQEIKQNSWLKLISPTLSEIVNVAEALSIPQNFLEDSLDIDERPRIEEHGENILMIIHVPFEKMDVINLADDVKYRTIPLGIIHTKDHFITICRENIPFLQDIMSGHEIQFSTHMKTRNTFGIIHETASAFIKYLSRIDKAIIEAEEELAKSYRNRELYSLLNLNESLLYMATSLKQMKYMMQKVLHGNYIKLYDEDKAIIDDALVELEQAHEVAEISQSNLSNLMDAYGNVIQNNVSHMLKFLAAITIVFSMPTLVASIYGMNVPLPFQDEPHMFTVLIIVMVILCGLCSFVFYKKRYF